MLPIPCASITPCKNRDQPCVHLDGNHLPHALRHQQRQRAQPRTDFQHHIVRLQLRRLQHAHRHAPIGQEILSPAFGRTHMVLL
jgi:dihydroorotate dehydrogenase